MTTVVCSICKRREVFFFRPYSGEKICKGCFTKSIENKVRATIAKYHMLQYDDRMAIAISGGKDSASLLRVLTKIEQDYPRVSLTAVTVDEGIGKYRDEALKNAAESCVELGVKHHVVSFKKIYGCTLDEISAHLRKEGKGKLTPCAYCGVLRRKALNIAARDVEANKIATAHTLDDETQTILLNILHGNPLGIAREKPITDRLHPKIARRVKPFCEIPEQETALYGYVNKIGFQAEPCPYASEAMRNPIRVFLNRIEDKHTGTKFALFKSAARIRPAIENMQTKEETTECTKCGEPTSGHTCRACEMLQQLFDL
ncbi:MAG: TIGR00269 family protein [Candidatus Bathyarchaeota archaeon]|nr:MAG: TIGR00269 family protein [Candidatus Bathyarchaeota archaeon]